MYQAIDLFYFKLFYYTLQIVYCNLEEMRRYQSESSTSILIDDLVVKAFKEAHERKIDRLMKDDVPQKELNYIYDVAVVMHNHN